MTTRVFARSIRFSAVVVLCLLAADAAFGQSYRGLIRGAVHDPSGAVIAGATVTATHSATGLSRSARTGADGSYVLPELAAGQYRVKVEAKDFAPAVTTVVVEVGLDTTADISLSKLAGASEAVTVTGAAPLVDSTRDVLGEVVTNRLVTQLPLNGRDFGKLVALVPGATVDPSGVAGTQFGFGQFNINGNRDRSNNYLLDGTDNNDPFFNNSAFNQTGIGGAPASILPLEAVQEFNLQSNFPAEYGRNSGSVVNIITNSGTNEFHGSVFEFVRNSFFDARNYFNPSPNPQSAFRNNQFGVAVGGPIIKDRTFFFAAYEGQRERVGSDFLFLVPTPAEKAAARTLALNSGLITSINPALENLLNLFPQSDTGTVPGSTKDSNDVNSFIVKIDHKLSDKHQLSGRYAFADSNQTFPFGGIGTETGSRFPQFSQISPTRVQLVSLSLLSTLSPTHINEIRFGYSRYRTSFTSADANFDPATLGFNFGTGKLGLPEFDFGGIFDNLGALTFSIPRGRVSATYQVLDNYTWLTGRHTFKFGGEFRHVAVDSFNDNLERGNFVYGPTGTFSQDPAVDILANYYVGSTFFTLGATGNTKRVTYNNGLGFFFQDDFRWKPNFTINLGMRWEYFGPLSEKHNLISNLAPDGTLAMVGTHGLSSAYNRDLDNFGPRIGFAWNVRNKTVVRGGYGIFYDYIPQDLMIANFTNSAGLVVNPVGPVPVLPLFSDQNALNGSAPGPIFTPGTPPFDIFFTPRNLATPYTQNYNLNIEQEITNAVALQVGYVGSKGTHLTRLLDANQAFVDGSRPNPNFGFMDEFATSAKSNYNALQTTLRMRNLHGFTGFAGYTLSKSLDDASDGIDFTTGVALPQNSNNLAAEYGHSSFDTRHRFTAGFNYDAPTFHAVPAWLGEGWEFSTVTSVQSGRPVNLVTSNDTSGFSFPTPANSHQRPNLVPGVNPILPNWNPVTGYFNPLAFQQPATGAFGDLGRYALYGPGFWQIDFSLLKTTKISERVAVQFRAEFFNIFNHTNFALPSNSIVPAVNADGTINSQAGAAGVITQTPDVAQTNPGLGGGGPRVLQFALKLSF
ncbi:MAG TPA: carboxypeptidase regulatory-like domain-containing protein [Terriglobales bacterium]|nr:carboxypeptidase regulatory-like domain-containing protein [Terriglobales bacterium]